MKKTFALGQMYERGLFVNKDAYLAEECYRESANDGDADAMFALGEMYEYGRFGYDCRQGKDYDKAIDWYTKAANAGNANAIKKYQNLWKQELSVF